MSQTILIENNFETKNLITLMLETFVGTEVIHQRSAEDAIGLLIHLVTEHLEVATKDVSHSHNLDYIPFPLHYFYDLKKALCDVYIRIRKDTNLYKFYKRVNAEESFDRWVLNRYHDNGLREFYVQEEDRKLLIEFISSELTDKLRRPDLDPEEMIHSASNAQKIVREIIHKSGLDEVAISLSEASVQSIVSSVVYTPEISTTLKMLLGVVFFTIISSATFRP